MTAPTGTGGAAVTGGGWGPLAGGGGFAAGLGGTAASVGAIPVAVAPAPGPNKPVSASRTVGPYPTLSLYIIATRISRG
ncbi:Uncharacterised protein [Mycobacterium tuberculosis]|nr:Uncharacterised protein [Mycobacterium tuberculosis]